MCLTVARQLFVMAIIVIISFFFSRKNNFGKDASQYLSRLLLYVINPCMIVSTFNVEYSAQKLKSLALAIAVSVAFHLVMMLAATLLFSKRIFGAKAAEKNPSQAQDLGRDALSKIGIVFTNSGFIGIPLINGVFGSAGVFYLMGYILVFNVLLWIWGEWLMTGSARPLKIILNPNILACAAGLAVFCAPFKMPYVVIEPLKMIGACNGAASMILLGLLFASFGGQNRSQAQTENSVQAQEEAGENRSQAKNRAAPIKSLARPLARDIALRLLFCPLLLLGAALFAMRLFSGFEEIELIMSVLFIAVCCPVGMSVSSFAVVFKKDADYASLLVALSSALCVATVPLMVALLEALA